MWRTLKPWLIAATIGAAGMFTLLLIVGVLTSAPTQPLGTESESVRDNAIPDDSCTFRIFGLVTDESGDPVEAATVSLRGEGPFATSNRVAVTNSSGRFVYLESGYGACVLENLYPTVTDPTNHYQEWTRPEPVENDEQFRIVLERAPANFDAGP